MTTHTMTFVPRGRAMRFAIPFAALILAGCPWDATRPKTPVAAQVAAGNGQTAIAGAAVAVNPAVKVVDEDGKGVPDITVTWAASGGGTVATPSSATNGDGIATPGMWTLGRTAGTNTLTATAAGVATAVAFTAMGTAGPPALVTPLGTQNFTGTTGSAVTSPPSVRVVDVNANGVPGVTVTFAVTSGGGALTGSTPVTNSSGIATLGGWTFGPTVGTQTITATVASIQNPGLVFTASVGAAATNLTITTAPGGVVTGEPFEVQPVIALRTETGSIATAAAAVVTASIASGTGTLSGSTSVNAVGGFARFSNLSITGTSPVTLQFAAPGLASVSTSVTPTVPPPFNLTINAVHLTQATQSYSGTVPIVAGRAALLRVFVKAAATNTATPVVRVQTFRNGAPLRTYTINAPGTSVPKVMDDGVLASSWNVLLPADEVVEGMSVLAEVDPSNAIAESSDSDNTFPASGTPLTLDVRQVSTMRITFVPITQPNVAAGNISGTTVDAFLDYSRRVYPFDTTDVTLHLPFSYGVRLNGTSYDASWTDLLTQLNNLRTSEGVTDRYYYGVAHPFYTSGGTGFGFIGQPIAVGMDFTGTVQPSTNYYSMTVAHEWGHNFGRRHVACGGPTGTDDNYPYTPTTSIGVTGYDPLLGVLRGANSYVDFMSYCQPLWISDYTYNAVLNFRATRFDPPPAAAQRALLVSGRVGPSGVVLNPAFEIDAPASFPSRAGPYTVQALDESGRQIFAVSFEGHEMDHAPGERAFSFAIPLGVSRPGSLRLLNGMQEIARRTATGTVSKGATTNAVPATRLVSVGTSRARLEWDGASYPMAMVRDAASGQVVAFLSGGAGEVTLLRSDVDVLLSNGVTSVRQRLQITPR